MNNKPYQHLIWCIGWRKDLPDSKYPSTAEVNSIRKAVAVIKIQFIHDWLHCDHHKIHLAQKLKLLETTTRSSWNLATNFPSISLHKSFNIMEKQRAITVIIVKHNLTAFFILTWNCALMLRGFVLFLFVRIPIGTLPEERVLLVSISQRC